MRPIEKRLLAVGFAALLASPAAAQQTSNSAQFNRLFGGLPTAVQAAQVPVQTGTTGSTTPATTGYSSGSPGVVPNGVGSTAVSAPGAPAPTMPAASGSGVG